MGDEDPNKDEYSPAPSPRTRSKNAKEVLDALKETDNDLDFHSEDSESTTTETAKNSAFLLDLSEYHEDDVLVLVSTALRGRAKMELLVNCRAPCNIECMLQDDSILPQSVHPVSIIRAEAVLKAIAKDEELKLSLQSLNTFELRVYIEVEICKDHPRAGVFQTPVTSWFNERVWRGSASLYSERIEPSRLIKQLLQAFLSLETGPKITLEFYTTSVCGEEKHSRRAIVRGDKSLEEAEQIINAHFS